MDSTSLIEKGPTSAAEAVVDIRFFKPDPPDNLITVVLFSDEGKGGDATIFGLFCKDNLLGADMSESEDKFLLNVDFSGTESTGK